MDRRGERLCPKQNCAGYKGSSMTLEEEESHGSFRRQIFFSPPKRWRQYSRWRIPFHLNTKVLSSAGDCFFLGHRLEARCPSRKPVHLQAAGKGETCFEEVRGLMLPRCRCKTKTISPSSSCLKSEHGSTTTTQTVTAGESAGVPVFLHFHCQLSLFRWISEEESRSGKAQRKV